MSTRTESHGRSLLPIQIQSNWLMIDADCVREVLGSRTWVPIPGASVEVPGVIPWRGRAVAVLDLAPFLPGMARIGAREQRARTVVLQVGDSLLALLVDAAREVQEIPNAQLRPPHATHQPLASFEVTLGETVMPVIDLHATVSRVGGASAGERT